MSDVSREDYEEAVGVLDSLRARAMVIADEIEGRSCSVSGFDSSGIEYTYYISGSEYGGCVPIEWVFADDWRMLHRKVLEDNKAEQARLKAEADARSAAEMEKRDRVTYERLKTKFG